MASATDVFTQINEHLAADPTKLANMNAVYAFDLEGSAYHIVIHDGEGKAGAGPVDNPNITITMKEEDFVLLATGKLDGTMAFMSGKLKIKGDMGLAMKLQSILR